MAIHEERIVETRPVVETRTRSGSGGFLYFAVGALIVAVGVLGYMYYSGQQSENTAVERSATAIGDAADKIGDSVKDMTRVPPQTSAPPTSATAPAPVEPASPPN